MSRNGLLVLIAVAGLGVAVVVTRASDPVTLAQAPAERRALAEPARRPSTAYYQPPPASRAFEAWTLRETISDSLSRIGAPAVPTLRRWLSDPNPEVRRQAADLLGRIGPAASDAIPGLMVLLDDEDGEVRKHAARALGQIGPAAADAVPVMTEILREEILKEQSREQQRRRSSVSNR